MSKLTPEQNTKCLEQQNKFFGGEVCDFPGAEALKRLYDVEMKNLGSGCYRCKNNCLLYTSPSPRDPGSSRMPSSA